MSAQRDLMPAGGGFFQRLAHLPSTMLGRISALLLLAWLVWLPIMQALPESSPPEGTQGGFNTGGTISAGILLAALVTGAIALIRGRERSWAVWLSTLIPGLAIVLEAIGQALHQW